MVVISNRLGLQPSEMLEVVADRDVWRLNLELLVADRDVWRLNLELLPPQLSRI